MEIGGRCRILRTIDASFSQRKKWGLPIGANGIHIVVDAGSEWLTVATNNLCEFEGEFALQLENWVA